MGVPLTQVPGYPVYYVKLGSVCQFGLLVVSPESNPGCVGYGFKLCLLVVTLGGTGSKFSWSHLSGCVHWKAKALKALEENYQYVLGHDVYLDKVETLCRRALIGRLEYVSLSKEEWVE